MMDGALWRYRWLCDCDVLVSELKGIRHLDSVRRLGSVSLTAIVLERDAQAPAILAPEIPQVANIGLQVGNHPGTQGNEGRRFVIERPLQVQVLLC